MHKLSSIIAATLLASLYLSLSLSVSTQSIDTKNADLVDPSPISSTERFNSVDNNENGDATTNIPGMLFKWEQYKSLYRKHYKSHTEYLFRFKQFIASSLKVAKKWFAFIKERTTTYYFGLNKFSDQTKEEKKLKLSAKPDAEFTRSFEPFSNHSSTTHMRLKRGFGLLGKMIAGSIKTDGVEFLSDWRQDCLTKQVMDQGDCGCCYAMASVKMFEWLYCKSRGEQHKFSEQIIIDCGAKFGLEACDQGNLFNLLNYVRARGLHAAVNFPYLGTQQDTCPIDEQSLEGTSIELKNVQHKVIRTDEEREFELKSSPLVAYVSLTDDFFDYSGGVYVPDLNEIQQQPELGHFMLLVGHGRDSKLGDFWLFSNSYGPDWGEYNGYIRIARNRIPFLGYAVKLSAEFADKSSGHD